MTICRHKYWKNINTQCYCTCVVLYTISRTHLKIKQLVVCLCNKYLGFGKFIYDNIIPWLAVREFQYNEHRLYWTFNFHAVQNFIVLNCHVPKMFGILILISSEKLVLLFNQLNNWNYYCGFCASCAWKCEHLFLKGV